jgi:homoserine kinase type II
MAIYTKLSLDDVLHVGNEFGLGIITHTPIPGGQANSSYLLDTTSGKYVLTVCNDPTFEEVSTLVMLLEVLAQHDFPTTRLIPKRNGEFVFSYGGNPLIMKKYIEGNVVQDMTPSMLRDLGAKMAQLHQIDAPDFLPQGFSFWLETLSAFETGHPYGAWLDEKVDYLQDPLSTDLPQGLVHTDIFYDNVIVSGDSVEALIDFETACHHYLLFDIAVAMIGSCEQSGRIIPVKARALLQGYEKGRSLVVEEREALQDFVVCAAAAYSFWRFRQYNVHLPTHENAESYREMTKIADDVHLIDRQDFIDALF